MSFPIGSTAIGQWWLPATESSEVAESGNYNYARLAARITPMIVKFGRNWTLTTTTGPAESTSRTYPAVRIDTVTGLSGNSGNAAFLGDSGVQIGDVVFFFHRSANPLQGDRISAGSESFVLAVAPNPIKPAGTVMFWQVWGRLG